MFKTKAAFKLPDPPKPPTQNMMEEDLKIASTDDDLFKLLLSTEDSESATLRNNESENITVGNSSVSDDKIFMLAIKLSKSYKELEEEAIVLEKKCAQLKATSKVLSENVNDVKKQALIAMSGS